MYNIRRRQHFPAGKLVVTREEKSSAKRFCFRLKHTASETYAKLQKVYGEDALPRATMFRWLTSETAEFSVLRKVAWCYGLCCDRSQYQYSFLCLVHEDRQTTLRNLSKALRIS